MMEKLHEIDKFIFFCKIDRPLPFHDSFWLVSLAQRRFVGRFFLLALSLSEVSSLGSRHLVLIHVVTRLIPRNSATHRLAVVDRRRPRLSSSCDASSSTRLDVGSSRIPRSCVQGRAHMEHVTLSIGRDQITRSHAKGQRLADVLLRLSLPCNVDGH